MTSPPSIEDPSLISRRAKVRVGVALVLLVTAIAILGILNQRKPVPQATTTAPNAQESISSAQVETAAPTTPVQNSISSPPPPTETLVPTTPPPPPPVPGQLPVMPEASAPPSSTKPAAEEKTAAPKPAITAPVQQKPAPAAAPKTQAEPKTQTEPKPQPAPVKPAAPPPAQTAAPREFQVQVGVFSDPENAKQLQAKLAEQGIPSHMETHLQVGPFKTRAEADAAREKLKSLGINAVINPVK